MRMNGPRAWTVRFIASLALVLVGCALPESGDSTHARPPSKGHVAKRGKRLYVASPMGFSELGRIGYKELLSVLRVRGFGIIDPWVLTDESRIKAVQSMPYGPEKRRAWRELNKIIGKNNALGIEMADGIVAVLDGPDVDSGTAAEIGFGAALGKPILGYRGDFRISADNEGSIVNLQVEYFIRKHGGMIVRSLPELESELERVFR